VVFPAAQLRQVLPLVQIIEIVSVLPDLVAPPLQDDPVLCSLILGKIFHVVVGFHQPVEHGYIGETAWKIEKPLAFLGAADDQSAFGYPGHLVAIDMAEQVEVGKAELRNAFLEQVEGWIHILLHRQRYGSELGIQGY